MIQKVDDGDYPSDFSLYKEMSARLRNLNGHNTRKKTKNFYESQGTWTLESTWHLEEHQHWPELCMDIVESAPRGKSVPVKLITVSGLKYGFKGIGYGR